MPKKLPKEIEEEQRKMKTWKILQIISLEETELPNHDLQIFLTCIYVYLLLCIKFQYFIYLFTVLDICLETFASLCF